MANQSEKHETKKSPAEESGDPGRTPGSAEGDEETIEQDLEDKLGAGASETD